ncbi:cysteinyl-tRNA synthetase [Thiohalorhabdus denitrificans]|uniref:Cysteine--tRNA ligase n=1 Tax=Thiohalorhabdus denitrificans TaxID=381306 RepID=A0A0P9CED0_9GAMM|nr:cysteine--tRNA ligase [Thiohalorhabdus denitrificans]KPV41243.1 cysteinyl-tRNA synthetase [Thiohalorhabdus denitrificans]SCY34787.1 cysteinyl-tRNA synthetase [Thiohalorhabdus denitrificans]
MTLHVYNSLTRQKERFEPADPAHVRMYVCGMTVYDDCHMGHARVMVVFDVIVRYLRARGYGVEYVRNITDIDDKIIARAAENNESVEALTERVIARMHEDLDALGVVRPDAEPRATQSVEQMIEMIQGLIDRGYAYATDSGDVYYAVQKFANYGRLSGESIEDLRAGARVEAEPDKRDPLDFALWKAAKPGEPAWDAPWGKGRPGWHIECSAMSTNHLGCTLDIHGGGADLRFPHHENEIAQSEAALDCTFAKYWIHNGFVRVDDEKMAKSLGNFFTIREVMEQYDPEILRFFLMSSHYRSPLNYTEDNLRGATEGLERLYTALEDVEPVVYEDPDHVDEDLLPWVVRFRTAMDDDFNTPEALAALFELAREVNKRKEEDPDGARAAAGALKLLAGWLGLLQRDPKAFLQRDTGGFPAEEIEKLIEQRTEARKSKDFATADAIRDRLAANGIELEDRPDGTVWRRGSS